MVEWQIKNLGDLCNIIGGGTPSTKKQEFYSGSIPWATVRDMKSEQLTITECSITNEAVKESSTNIIPGGNVVIATRVGLGKVCVLGQDTAINQDLRGVVPKSTKALDVGFLFWWLKSVAATIVAEGTGATVQGVKLPFVKSLQVPLPPLPEQKRIVAILDEAFAGIDAAVANTKQNLANARELFESYLNAVFTRKGEGWVEKPLGEVCEYINGKAHEQCINDDGKFIVINSKFVSTEGRVFKRANTALMLLKPDDITMVLSDVPNGKALAKCFLVDEANKYTLNQRICLIRSRHFQTKFLFYQLNRNPYFLSFDNGGNQTNMRLNQVLSCPLFIPPMQEQETIAEKIDALQEETQRLESIYKQKLAALAELKQSILQKAFAGELTAKALEEAVA